jgi:hypothetical protein
MGWLFLIDDDQRLGPAELPGIRTAADQAGMLLYADELAQRLSASILSNLFGPAPDLRDTAAQQLIEQGLASAENPHSVVYLRPGSPEVLRELRHLGLAQQDHCVLLVVSRPGVVRQAADEARDMLCARLGTRVVAGIGDPQPHLTGAVVSYRQALLAARVATAIPAVGDVTSWSRLGAYRALVQLPPGERSDESVDPRLRALLDADAALAETIETYLDLGGDAARTAARLSVHRATLYYRLNKAQQLAGVDLRDGQDRLALHVGFKLLRLTGRVPRP